MKKQERQKVKKKRNIRDLFNILVPIMIFVTGAGIFLYPAISNAIAEYEEKTIIHTYEATIDETSQEEIANAWALAEEYNENLNGDPVHDPFVLGSGYVLPDNYEEVLNVNGDGVMGYIDIPEIDVYLPIYHGTSEEVLAKGAGHIEASSLPIGGKFRHSVISAHRGLPSAELFTILDELKVGDQFYIHVLDETLAYQVDQISVIEPDDLSKLSATASADYVTLLTCTPYGVNTHRLLVRGTRVPYVPEEAEEQAAEASFTMSRWMKEYILSIALGITLVFVIVRLFLGKRKKTDTLILYYNMDDKYIQKLAEKMHCDVFELQNDPSIDLHDYKYIFIGYSIYHPLMNEYLKEYDFKDKNVIPFVISDHETDVHIFECNDAEIKEGKCFLMNVSVKEIMKWMKDVK